MDNIRFIVAKSNEELGRLTAQRMGMAMTQVNSVKHANRELKVQIQESIRKKNVYILATGTSNSENSVNDYLMELFLIIDACKLSSANSISVLLPAYPYARSDKKDDGRTSIAGSLISRILKSIGTGRIVSMDLHADQIQGFIDLPFDNLEARQLFVTFIQKNYFKELTYEEINNNYILVSPDGGGVKRVEKYAKRLGMNFVIMHKQRDYTKESTVISSMLIGSVDNIMNKTAIIIDDIIDTMGTMISAANELHEKGINKVIILATHGILSGPAIDRINNCDIITDIIVTNTLPQMENQTRCPKLKIVDTSELFGEVILRLESGDSISSMFHN
jgi:ribose-phosphate pyrophosphokinase